VSHGEAIAAVRAAGTPLGDDLLVLRPRKRWLPGAGSAILAALALVNLRALVKRAAA
jgi:hypothetical protein